jgi:hypothetical protein
MARLVAVAIALGPLAGACGPCTENDFDAEVADVQRSTQPEGSMLTSAVSASSSFSLTHAWTVVAPGWNWTRYQAWVQRFLPLYKPIESSDGLVLRRLFDGDVVTLQLRHVGDDPLKVRISLEAIPF